MARWEVVEREVPELAAAAKRYLEARGHRTIATLRADGSPRISGTELRFADGDLWFGSMYRSNKALDLLRDPRFALHSGSDEPDVWTGDATVSGTVEEADAARMGDIYEESPPGPAHLFRADVTEVTVVTLAEARDHLILESWVEGRGYRRRTRT
ncbi:MAG TPA: pyridoxamine 5'-phosphate oxidase family protein [Miltoncostaea sp.]|nr:pyridoxamine 5'-phosphate oxidase family protein [Miltoncostaea sp.]